MLHVVTSVPSCVKYFPVSFHQMKSPSYILKNHYHERNLQRGLEQHVRKLEEISYQPPQLIAMQKTFQIVRQLDIRNKNQQIASKFNEMETVLERNRENESLIGKLKVLKKKPLNRTIKTSYSSKSLIQECKRKEENRIILENFNLAKRMINLPPVISNKKLDQEYAQHKHDLNLIKRYHSQKPTQQAGAKHSALQAQLNSITKHRFSKTKSASNLTLVHRQVSTNQMLCLIELLSLKLSSGNPQNHNSKNPAQFYWEIKHGNKTIGASPSKDFDDVTIELLDFIVPVSAQITLILHKLKNNDEVYVGQIEFDSREFADPNEDETHSVKVMYQLILSAYELPLSLKSIIKIVEDKQVSIGLAQIKVTVVRSRKVPDPLKQENIQPEVVKQLPIEAPPQLREATHHTQEELSILELYNPDQANEENPEQPPKLSDEQI